MTEAEVERVIVFFRVSMAAFRVCQGLFTNIQAGWVVTFKSIATLYDIIGDLHGQAELLIRLLKKQAYRQGAEGWKHPDRKAIFLGDFINKGPESRKVLSIVMQMVEHKNAYAIVGNHELKLLFFFHKHEGGAYIQAHSPARQEQLKPALQAFADDRAALLDYMRWLQRLPLLVELPGLRAVHAFWHRPSIRFLKNQFPEMRLSDELLRSMLPGSRVERAVHELLVGLKLPLPGRQAYFKARWWNLAESDRYRDLAIRPDDQIGNPRVDLNEIDPDTYRYPDDGPPLFFGHYNLPGDPRLLAGHYACLDFNREEQPLAVAYHWDGEQKLKAHKFSFVV
jgi:hypothetical protein